MRSYLAAAVDLPSGDEFLFSLFCCNCVGLLSIFAPPSCSVCRCCSLRAPCFAPRAWARPANGTRPR